MRVGRLWTTHCRRLVGLVIGVKGGQAAAQRVGVEGDDLRVGDCTYNRCSSVLAHPWGRNILSLFFDNRKIDCCFFSSRRTVCSTIAKGRGRRTVGASVRMSLVLVALRGYREYLEEIASVRVQACAPVLSTIYMRRVVLFKKIHNKWCVCSVTFSRFLFFFLSFF